MSFKSNRLPQSVMLFLCLLFPNLCMTAWFAWYGPDVTSTHGFLFLTSSAIAYSVFLLFPTLLLLLPTLRCKSDRTATIWAVVSSIMAATTILVLLIDAGILFRYGYHINGLVINLLCTRGGFRSMGLDSATIAPVIAIILLVYLLYIAFALVCFRWKRISTIGSHLCGIKPLCALFAFWAIAFLFSLLSTGHADFFADTEILAQQNAFPCIITVRMRKFLRRLGFHEPDRKKIPEIVDPTKGKASLHYPLQDIKRNSNRHKYNIIWLVAESLRADFLKEDIMPQTYQFAQSAIRFDSHYSGGHGTRPAMFSMFYGLYGLNWEAFMNQRRGPVFIDWLLEDNYQFLCQTSADFTYPEFDKTIFAALPQDVLVEVEAKTPWEKDAKLIDSLVDFVKNRDKSRPFFTFGFFESTHAPYTFPESAVIRPDYMKKINYTTVSEKDATLLYNRDCNAAHYLDTLFAKVIAMLEEDSELRDNTIVVFTGDHGEEFFEKGRLGHNSTFSEEQTRIPLVLKLPGKEPAVCPKMTHHTDIVPTLAPFFGVETPAREFCIGQNLLADDFNREFFLICGWETAVLVNKDYKYVLPIHIRSAFKLNTLTHRDDSPCTDDEEDTFISRFASQLAASQEELHRFMDR
ncbi:MAG: sulfatase-like hydrolase/transferase [Victivallales bacterium]|nr:sulfatase-like hydrolase/transferase [Victivallales bacterium]